ncbi:hypothetical protein Aduo_011654 [Ancylostoma duodenale]
MDLRLQHRRSKRPQVPLERIKWWKLTKYKSELETVVKTASETASAGDVNTKWSILERAITQGARNLLGTTKPGRPFIDKQTWWWSDCEEVQALVKKKEAYKKWLRTRSDDNMREYGEAKAVAKKAVAAAKAARYRALCEELDTTEGEKKIYRIAKARQRATEDLGDVVQIKDSNGHLLHRLPDILNRWSEHYHAMCSEEFPHPPIPTGNLVSGPVPPIKEEEIAQCTDRLGCCVIR